VFHNSKPDLLPPTVALNPLLAVPALVKYRNRNLMLQQAAAVYGYLNASLKLTLMVNVIEILLSNYQIAAFDCLPGLVEIRPISKLKEFYFRREICMLQSDLLLESSTAHQPVFGGGVIRYRVPGETINAAVTHPNSNTEISLHQWTFEFQCLLADVCGLLERNADCVAAFIDLKDVIQPATKADLIKLARLHGVWLPTRLNVAECRERMTEHVCEECPKIFSIFRRLPSTVRAPIKSSKKDKRLEPLPTDAQIRANHKRVSGLVSIFKWRRKVAYGRLRHNKFPPRPLSMKENHKILTRYCKTISPRSFMERGCAVCGYLTAIKQLTPLTEYKGNLNILVGPGVTRRERFSLADPIQELEGPILADDCSDICVDCQVCVDNGVVPKLALSRHNWIGPIPDALKDLSFAENIMIAKIRHNRCVVSQLWTRANER
jgi:hypothetical protein